MSPPSPLLGQGPTCFRWARPPLDAEDFRTIELEVVPARQWQRHLLLNIQPYQAVDTRQTSV